MWPLPFYSKRQQKRRLQDYLVAHADALIAGTLNLDDLARQFEGVDLSHVESLLTMTERINNMLDSREGVIPSEQFVARLRHELLTSELFDQPSLVERFRQMPPRSQLEVAAGIGGATLTAGVVVLLATRPLLGMIESWREKRLAA